LLADEPLQPFGRSPDGACGVWDGAAFQHKSKCLSEFPLGEHSLLVAGHRVVSLVEEAGSAAGTRISR
jgi:hypothetical protein